MKSAFFSILLFIMTILPRESRAEVLEQDKLMKYPDLVVLANTAMSAEIARVNAELAKGNFKIPGYKEKDLKFFVNLNKDDFTADYLNNKCIMDDKSVEAILSRHMSLANDGVTASIGSLSRMQNDAKQLWSLISKMCQFSEVRFAERLGNLTSNGQPVGLNDVAIKNLTLVVFFPTEFGKPSFKKALAGRLAVITTVGLMAGTAASLAEAPFAGVFISLAVLSSTTLSLKGSIPKAQNKLRNLEITNIDPNGLLKIDFNEDELAQVN